MGVNDERRKKRLRKGNRKIKKAITKATQELVHRIDTEERRKVAQAIIDQAMKRI